MGLHSVRVGMQGFVWVQRESLPPMHPLLACISIGYSGQKKDAGVCGPTYVSHVMLCFQEEVSCVFAYCHLSVHLQGRHLTRPPSRFPTPVLSAIHSISLYARSPSALCPLGLPL